MRMVGGGLEYSGDLIKQSIGPPHVKTLLGPRHGVRSF